MSIKVIGMDVSLNHSGFVELVDGELSNFWYITTVAASANRSKEHGYRLKLLKSKDKQAVSVARLADVIAFVLNPVLKSKPDFIALEDYAFGKERQAHQLGEIGGLVRLFCWSKGFKFRLYDPRSIKMFATHDGTAQKDLIERKVKERWNQDFSKFNQPIAKATKKRPFPKQQTQTSEDLADAFAIAKLVWLEVQLRKGNVLMNELHEKEIQIFNRTTKKNPVSLLGRDWIYNKGRFEND